MSEDERRRAEVDGADAAAVLRSLQGQARAGRMAEALAPLRDRLEWNRTPAAAQDYLIALAGGRLGAGWRHSSTAVYDCGGERHRIASFAHEPTGILLNLIPGGTFLMGSSSGDADERPVHEVTIPPLWLGVTPVTQAQWDCVEAGGALRRRAAKRPVTGVSWTRAQAWLESSGLGLRLPSESEWESACRAGTQSEWAFGDERSEIGHYAWFEDNSGSKRHEVGKLRPNAFGLYDIHGNVSEWCEDHWIRGYRSGPRDHRPRSSRASTRRVVRGGSWCYNAASARSACRVGWDADWCDDSIGFRVAKDLDASPGASAPSKAARRRGRRS